MVIHPPELVSVDLSLGEQPLAGPAQHCLADSCDRMHVDCGVHQCAGEQQTLGGLDVALVQDEFAVDKGQLPNQPLGVDRAVGDAGVVGVPNEVVHPVDIEFARYQLAELSLTGNKASNMRGVQIVLAEGVSDLARREEFVDVVVVFARMPGG